MKTFKLFLLALCANLAPLATGVSQLVLGNTLTGIATLAGTLGVVVTQALNAKVDAKYSRAPVGAFWFFRQLYVWLFIVLGIIISLIIWGNTPCS